MSDLFLGQYVEALTLQRIDRSYSAAICLASVSLLELKKHILQFLHPTEYAYYTTLKFAKRQASYLLGHFTAKQAIAFLTHNDWREILLEYGVFHFPIVHAAHQNHLQVSYSHGGQWAVALAFPEAHPMGIDLEDINPNKTSVIETQLTVDEKDFVSQGAVKEKMTTLFWTVKEALSKVFRTGMMAPFSIYAIKNVREEKGVWSSEFVHFSQYKALSFCAGSFVCSIVYPKKSEMMIDIPAIQAWAAQQIVNNNDKIE